MLPSRWHLFQGRLCLVQQDNAGLHFAHATRPSNRLACLLSRAVSHWKCVARYEVQNTTTDCRWLQNKWSCTSSKNDKEFLNFSDAVSSVPKHLLRVVQSKGEWTHMHLSRTFSEPAAGVKVTINFISFSSLCTVLTCGSSAVFKGRNCLIIVGEMFFFFTTKCFLEVEILRWAIQSMSVLWEWCQVSGHMEIFIVWKKNIIIKKSLSLVISTSFSSTFFFFWVLH